MANTNQVKIEVIAEDLASQVLNNVNEKLEGTSKSAGLAGMSFGKMTGAIALGTTIANGLQTAMGFVTDKIKSATEASIDFAMNAIDSYTAQEKALTSLGIYYNNVLKKAPEEAQEAASNLSRELRIGIGSSAEALQRLLKSGLNIDQASELMKRFANEAITGKEASMSLSTAVENLAMMYQTGNSMLGDRAGISENMSNLLQEQADKEGVVITQLTKSQQEQLKYRAFLELTNETLGSAQVFQGGLIDNLAVSQQATTDLANAIGQVLAPAYNVFVKAQIVVKETLLDFVNAIKDGFAPNVELLKEALGNIVENFKQLFDVFTGGQRDAEDVNNTFQDLGRILSEKLLNGLYAFNDALIGFREEAPKIKESLQPVFDAVTNFFDKLTSGGGIDHFGTMSEQWMEFGANLAGNVANGITTAFNAIKNIYDFFDRNQNNIKTAFEIWTTLGKVFLFIEKIKWELAVKGIQLLLLPTMVYFTLWKNIFNFIKEVPDKLREFGASAGEFIKQFVDNIYNAFESAKQFIINAHESFKETIENIVLSFFSFNQRVVETVSDMVLKVREFFNNIFKINGVGWIDFVNGIVLGVVGKFVDMRNGIINQILDIFNNIKTAFVVGFDFIKSVVSTGLDFIKNNFNIAKDTIGNILTNIKDFIVNNFNIVKNFVINSAKTILDPLVNGFNSAKDTIGNILTSIKDLVINTLTGGANVAGSLANSFRSLIHSLVDKINESLKFEFSVLGQNISIDLPDIPKFAKGVQNFGGGLALVGEEGPELINLPSGSDVIPNRQTQSILNNNNNSQVSINVNYSGQDPQAFANYLAFNLNTL